jgi:non-heme chloroperoxidase
MVNMRRILSSAACLLAVHVAGAQDNSPHESRFVRVARDVQLEVLDWGGSGRPVVLLAGLGATAHDFDDFAPKLTSSYHLYAITRRGYGRSSAPAVGYDADELGDDVLAVIDSLQLRRPVIAGHSIAGEELSSIGSRHPEKVSGLIYLDAGADYAFYDSTHGHVTIDANEIIRRFDRLRAGSGASPWERHEVTAALADTLLQEFLRRARIELASPPPRRDQRGQPADDPIEFAVTAGMRKYTSIRGPVLAIFANPLEPPPGARNDPNMREMVAEVDSAVAMQVRAFARGVPQARVVSIPNAAHFIYRSDEAEVLREMKAFIDGLPKPPM